MKASLLVGLFLLIVYGSYSQKLKFEEPNKIYTREEKTDHTITINFSMDSAKSARTVTITIDDGNSSATKDKDYTFTDGTKVELKSENKFSGKIDIVIKADQFNNEGPEDLHLKFSYKDNDDKDKSTDYLVLISDLNSGSDDDVVYTDAEKTKMKGISYEIFTGSNFDFFNSLKLKNIGGELVLKANDILDKRWGFYTGLFNFQYFTYDSSSLNVRVQNIRIDTGTYMNGITRYIRNTFVDHPKISTNQWGYYFNPTFRLNTEPSNLFNIYAALRLEVLRTSTTTEFITDTVSMNDTTKTPLNGAAVFQSGKGFLLQKYTNTVTNGYFGIGFPMWLNAQGKVKFYFDPNVGLVNYTTTAYVYVINENLPSRRKVEKTSWPGYYLFRFRVIDQFSGLQITTGGEIRGLFPQQTPAINLYLGLKADLAKWFGKSGPGTSN